MTRLIRLPEVLECTGMTRPTLYRRIAVGEFPRQVKLGARASAWDAGEVDAWIEARKAERPARRAKPMDARMLRLIFGHRSLRDQLRFWAQLDNWFM